MTDGRRRARPTAGSRPPAKRGPAATRRTAAKPAARTKAGTARSTSPRSRAAAPKTGARATGLRGSSRRVPARRAPRRRPPKRRVTRYRTRLLVGLAIPAVVVPVLLLGLYPTRPYLAQRTSTHEAEEELAQLKKENAALTEERDALMSSDEIERRAREDHGFIKPGEEPFAVVPPPPPPVELPEVWPFTGADALLNG